MTLHLHHPPQRPFYRPSFASVLVNAVIWVPLVWWLAGCAAGGGITPQAQTVVDVLCKGDEVAQPIIVPIVMLASPVAGPAQPAVAAAVSVDQLLVHPLIRDACDKYKAKPVAIVPAVPAGAVVAAPVLVTAAKP